MSNLYGIETEDDCRAKIDELLALNEQAEQTPNTETVSAIKLRLRALYQEGQSGRHGDKMSQVESAFFWPAIQEAYVHAPNIRRPSTWNSGLWNFHYYLTYYRPRETQPSAGAPKGN